MASHVENMGASEVMGTWTAGADPSTDRGRRRSRPRSPRRTTGSPEYVGFVGDEVWWTEPRPAEGGRRALVRRRADGTEQHRAARAVERAQPRHRVRRTARGPGAGRPDGGPLVVFVHFADQRLYAYEPDAPGAVPRPLTPVSAVGGGLRWADPQLHLGPGRSVVRPGGVHRRRARPTCAGSLAAVPLDGSAAEDRGAVRELTDGRHRFVTGPAPRRPTAGRPPGSPGTTRGCRGTAPS